MEYEFLRKIQKIPYWIRIVLGVLCLIYALIAAILPIVSGTIPVSIIGVLFLISAKKVKKVRKIRKGLQYLFSKFSWERFKTKMKDFKTHIKEIMFHK